MCDHTEHYIGYNTTDYNSLCFRHATIEAVKGFEVDVEITTYQQRDCELCKIEGEVEQTRQDEVTADLLAAIKTGAKK